MIIGERSCRNCGEPIIKCAKATCLREPAWVHRETGSHRCPDTDDFVLAAP